MTTQTTTVSKQGVTTYELAMAEPGIEAWRNTRETTNEKSLKTLTTFIGIARKVANESKLAKPFLKMTAEEAGKLNAAMKARGLSGAIFVALKSFFTHHEMTRQAKNIKPRKGHARMRPDLLVTVEEQNKMLAACTNLRDRALLAVLWDTGVRIHEACALKLRDVSVETHSNGTEHKLVKLWIGKTKTLGEERSVLTGPEASAVVLTWTAKYPGDIKGGPDRPLFPSHASNHYGSATSPGNWGARIREIAARAGFPAERVKQVHPHLLRHTWATNLLRAGVAESIVKKLGGWSAGSTVLGSTYSHLVDADTDNATLARNGFEAKRVKVEPIVVPRSVVSPMPQQWVPGNVSIDSIVEKKVRALLGMRTEESLDGGPGD